MIKIDKDSIFSIINRENLKSVGLAAPDGLIYLLPELAHEIEEKGVETFVFLEPSYGTCDLQNSEAERLNLDAVFNIGHSTTAEKMGKKTYLIKAEYVVEIEPLMDKTIDLLRSKGYKRVSLFTTSNYQTAMIEGENYLSNRGFEVIKSKPFPSLFEGQIFGCNYYAPLSTSPDAYLFIGQSMFHAVGIYLSTSKPTYMLDPHFVEIIDVSNEGELAYKKSILGIYKARDGEKFGIIIGLKEGQSFRAKGEWFKRKLTELGKVATLMALRDISPNKINAIRDYDAFIELGCPRIPMADRGFEKPILSYPQGLALINLLEGKEIGNLFNLRLWA